MTETPDWWMKGDWFDACSYSVPCPCGFVMTFGKTVENEADAFGVRWSLPGQSSKHIPFDWTGPAFG